MPENNHRVPTPSFLKARISPADFYADQLPGVTLKPNGDGWTHNVCCPFHEDKNPSFGVHLDTGAFRCFACGAQGGSVIDFAMRRESLDLDQARRALADRYGIEPDPGPSTPPRRPTVAPAPAPKAPARPPAPIPPEALAKRPQAHHTHGAPSATWEYRDAQGRPVGWVYRFDPEGKPKFFIPLTWDGSRWQWHALPAPRPLYGLDRLAARPDAAVVLCEGEKAADAAGRMLPDLVATASMNGAQSPRHTDWSPLAGRRVLIWPDNDPPGAKYAQAVADLARDAGALSVAVLDLAALGADLAKGWDAADAEKEGLQEKIRAWVAKPGRGPERATPGDSGPDPVAILERAIRDTALGDPGACFTGQAGKAWAAVYRTDQATYHRLRADAKRAGVPKVTLLDKIARGQVQRSHGDDDRPEIELRAGDLDQNIIDAESALLASGTELYQFAGDVVRPVRLQDTLNQGGAIVQEGSLILTPVSEHWLRRAMGRAARFVKYSPTVDDIIPADVPLDLAKAYLASAGEWRVPPVIGISECPTIRRDGSLILESGYDTRSGVFVDYQGPPVAVPDQPTREDALKALAEIEEPFEEFPFVGEKSVALAAVLTGVARRSLPTAPMFAFDAPKAGSGKGLLADVVSLICTGRTSAMFSQGRDEAEDEKRLAALLMRSTPTICLDNVEREIRGDFLCSILTQERVTARVLGLSRMADLQTNTLVMATGNNLRVAGDMTRRVLMCGIDPEHERPDERTFKRDLRSWVPAHRARLLRATLTILRAYAVAGRPAQPIKPYGSFEVWSNTIRAALVWLGVPDPCGNRGALERDDPVSVNLRALLEAWHNAMVQEETYNHQAPKADQGRSVAEVIAICEKSSGGGWVYPDLHYAALDVAPSARNPDTIDRLKLGRYLSKFEKRVEGGYRIKRTGTDSHAKAHLWVVEKIKSSFTPKDPNGPIDTKEDNNSAGIAGIAGNENTQREQNGFFKKVSEMGSVETLPAIPASPANPDEEFF